MSTVEDIEPEQITNTEDLNSDLSAPTTPKVKNPKKVAAGKALARKNAEARKNVENLPQEESTNVNVSTIYNGILSISGLVGAGFTLYHGWKFFETSGWSNDLRAKSIYNKPKVEEVKEVKEVKKVEEVKEVKKSKSVTPLVSPSLRG